MQALNAAKETDGGERRVWGTDGLFVLVNALWWLGEGGCRRSILGCLAVVCKMLLPFSTHLWSRG